MTARTSFARRALVTVVATLAAAVPVAAPAAASAAGLDDRIGAVVRRSSVASQSSVYAWDQETRDVIYARNASRQVTPASTMKLLTSAAALARFGPEHTFSTRVALEGEQVGSTWQGDVWLIGGGDPSLSTGGFARDNLGGRGTNLARLVQPLVDRGIRTVTGRVRVDDSLLDEVRWVPEWKPSFRLEETGALGALTVNQSLLGKWVGTTSSRAPDLHAGTLYRGLLGRAGVRVVGGALGGTAGARAEVVGTVSSPPLRVLLHHMNQASDNFYAEILLKDIGADRFGEDADGSTEQGRRAATAELAALGVDTADIRWTDGSGLAYGNRVTARAVGHVLGVGAQADWGEDWIRSFARSGTSGTLRRRMTRAPYRGRVTAKTGTLRHASALAGFAERVGSGRRYGFAVLTYNASGAQVSYTAARNLQDRIAMVLVR